MRHPIHPVTEQVLIFLLGAATIHGIYLSILLLLKNENNRPNRLLTVSIFSVSLYLTNYLFFLTGFIVSFPHLLSILSPAIYLVGPAFYFFIKSSLKPDLRWKWFDTLHLLPFIHNCWRTLRILRIDTDTKLSYIEKLMNPEGVDFSWIDFLSGTYSTYLLLGYLIAAWLLCRKSAREINQKEEAKAIRWLEKFCLGFGLLIFVDFLIKITGFALALPSFTMEYLVAASTAVAIHIAGYFAIGRLPRISPKKKKYESSSLTKSQMNLYQNRVLNIMKEEKPWMQTDLKMRDLAKKVNLPSHQLSQVLNEGMEISFFELMNKYRIEEIKRRLLDPVYSHYSILAIAFDCGFNNKATFNRVFRKMTGKTPSEFVKRNN